MAEKLPVAFLAGLLSVITPCVLPLVPGYLSAVSAVDVTRLGERGSARRVALSSIPFIAGFTAVFVVLGAGAAAIASSVSKQSQTEIAGFILVVLGLAFMGLLPWPERTVAPELLQKARRGGSSILLGGAFAVCAAPCIGPVLASVLAEASTGGGVVRGGILLVWPTRSASVQLGSLWPAGVAFARAMATFRWVRSHYRLLRIGSGGILVALGLLLLFDRDWWLRLALDQLFSKLGLPTS